MSSARVTATHRRALYVRDEAGRELPARFGRRELSIACGDLVQCEFDAQHAELRVAAVEPRRNGLYRSNSRGGGELIAANLTQLLVVIAALPRPDYFVADRYLCAAHCSGIAGIIVLNKRELPPPDDLQRELDAWRATGVAILEVSANTGHGLDPLKAQLSGHISMLVGQSGVGKSSLLRALLPECDTAIGELIRDDEGRHTTTATRLYALPGGGDLLDSAGVRDFAPAIDYLDPSALGFAEIESLAAHCRFGDCRHLREPGCAVRASVDVGGVNPRRYESYRRLRRLYDRLRTQRSAAGERRFRP
ncbi:MAG TPA: ribosome small subunit-dependent GTPase A [Steroidobacteraceae bacterium]|jgi:ribosome biogenesis GTPase|nr:ribosome small subunit-dependent GTPase A [Steroidobacteraceae bacterium]